MGYEHQIKLFREGATQVVHIPPGLELPGTDAVMRKVGSQLIIEAAKPRESLFDVLSRLEPLDEDFPEIEDLPPDEVNL